MSYLKQLREKSNTQVSQKQITDTVDVVSKESNEEINKSNLHPVVRLVASVVIKKLFKKFLANPVREFFYSKMRYQKCHEEALTKTLNKLRTINNTAIVDGYEVKEVPGKAFTNSFIVNGKQLKTEDDIYNGTDIIIKEAIKLQDIIANVHKQAKDIKSTNDDDRLNEALEIIQRTVPKNIFIQVLPDKEPTPLTKVEGCNDIERLKSKMINTFRPELMNAYNNLKGLEDDETIDSQVKTFLIDSLQRILNRYFTFLADVTEWMYRSAKRQSKIKPSNESISVEDYYYSLEEAEKEESEYDAENAVEEDTSAPDLDETEEETETNPDEETTESGGEEETGTSEEGTETSSKDEESQSDVRDSRGIDEQQEEIRLDVPDEEKVAIRTYLEPLLGDNINELTLYSANQINRPLYHVSMNPNIKGFVPKVSRRTLGTEDRSLPRISSSTSLIGCLNGYQSMVSDMEGRATKNFTGLFKVYELPYQYAVKPSRRLLADVELSDEYWLVSWKKETYTTIPNPVADFTIPKIETVYGNDGVDNTFHCYIKVYQSGMYIDHQRKLEQGFYHVVLNGYNFKYPLKNNNLIQVHEISEEEYNKVVALSMMIKKR